MRYTLPWFPLSDGPSRCSCRTIRGCRLYRSSLSDADLVAVKVVDFLFAFAFGIGPVADLRQGFVGIRIGVDIGIPAVRLDFLQEVAAVPNESGFFFEARLKLLRFSDGLCLSFCPRRRRCRSKFLCCRLF